MRTRSLAATVAAATLPFALAACDGSATSPRIEPRAPAQIVNGQLDGSAHPAVVLVVMDVAGHPTYACSGTLLAPTVVLTAGHCAGEPGEFSGMRIFTESDVLNGTNSFPFAGGANSVEAVAWHAHPQFTEAAYYLHDVGVIQLAAPVTLAASAYGQLPTTNQLDGLRSGRGTTFTTVGYGTQRVKPTRVSQFVRMTAEPYLLQSNTPFTGSGLMLLSNNASSGGSCFGDSGGPNFVGETNVIAAVVSFGLNENCAGTGMVFRLDRADVLSFVQQYLGS